MITNCCVCGFPIEDMIYKCKKCLETYCGHCAVNELCPDDICTGCKLIELEETTNRLDHLDSLIND